MSEVATDKITFHNAKFGEMTIEREAVVTFPFGVPGFERCKEYGLIALEDEAPFIRLLSINEAGLGFVILDPLLIWPDYDPNISDEDLEGLELESIEDLAVYCMVTLSTTPGDVTANLKGPVCINMRLMKAKQMILVDERYNTKHPLMSTGQENQ